MKLLGGKGEERLKTLSTVMKLPIKTACSESPEPKRRFSEEAHNTEINQPRFCKKTVFWAL